MHSGLAQQILRPALREEVLARAQSDVLRARDEWLTVVSHELRTPLTALCLDIFS